MNNTEFQKWVRKPGWAQLLFGLIVGALIVGVFAVLGATKANAAEPQAASTEAGTYHHMICPPHPDPELVCNVSQFIGYFKHGRYGFNPINVRYSHAFHKFFMHTIRHYARQHTGFTPCPGSPNLGCTYSHFVNHDSCAVSSLPDTFDADSCRASHHLRGLLSSPYWTRRGDLQTKWHGRIVLCGTTAVLMLTVAGAPVAAVGIGASSCLGGKVVD